MTRRACLLASFTLSMTSVGIAAQTSAHADTFPEGSYTKTCSNIHWGDSQKDQLRAFCSPKSSDTAAAESAIDVFTCNPGTIENRDGVLSCIFNIRSVELKAGKKVRPAFNSAAAITIGHLPTDMELADWTGFGQKDTDWADLIYHETLDFTSAAAILRKYLKEGATPAERRAVYVAAYRQVWGKDPGIIDVGGYDAKIKAGTAWYSTIVIDQRKLKNAPAPAATFPSGTPPPPIH